MYNNFNPSLKLHGTISACAAHETIDLRHDRFVICNLVGLLLQANFLVHTMNTRSTQVKFSAVKVVGSNL